MQRWLLLLAVMGCSEEGVDPTVAVEAEAEPAVEEEAPAAEEPQQVEGEAWSRRTVPDGEEYAAARRGLELAEDTHRLLPDNVGNGLNCTNCHLEGGQRAKAAPWVGVSGRYPKYRARSGKEDDIQDRVNGCFERSMAGTVLERDSEPMLAIVAYMDFLSEGVENPKEMPGKGMPKFEAPATPDPVRGAAVYTEKCASCQQAGGLGLYDNTDKTVFPPLWGDRSFNIGAGMARLNTAAAFVKWNMPLGQGGTLTDQEAYDVAAYFTVKERQDFEKKALDWPKGGKPEDARY